MSNAEITKRGIVASISEILIDLIKSSRQYLSQGAVLTLDPLCKDDVETLQSFTIKLRNGLRSILEVAIHYDNPITMATIKTGSNCTNLTEITSKLNSIYTFISFANGLHNRPRVIRIMVIHKNKLERCPHPLKNINDSLMQFGQRLFTTINWNYNREIHN